MKIKIPNPMKNLKEKYYQLGYQEGKNDFFDVGYEKGLEIGFYKGKESNHNKVDLYLDILNKLFENQEKEIKELREKINSHYNSQYEYNNTQIQTKSDKEIIDDHMLFFKNISDIIDSSFFSTVLYQTVTSQTIKSYVDFIDYLQNSIEVKSTYPETVKLLPKLKSAYEKLYQNKLAVEEAERLI